MNPKKLTIGIFTLFSVCLADYSYALQKKNIADVSSDELISETQTGPADAGDNHTSIVWWLPHEFWMGVMERDPSISKKDKEEMLQAVEGVSILAIVQSDISSLGAFDFYDREQVERGMVVSQTRPDGTSEKVPFQEKLNPDLEVVMAAFRPILATAMGKMGDNMHFFVLSDTLPSGGRRLDPYQGGELKVKLEDRSGRSLISEIELPLNSLYVSRTCPNGKKAHVSWNFCPWTGEKLQK